MKKMRVLFALALSIGLLLGPTSCTVFFTKDNGKHKGFYKNPKNRHNPNYMDAGKSNGKRK